MSLTPKHWAEFQHYKDRSPIWIKLHRKLLDDFAFHRLPVASRALAPMLWLLASEYNEGKITATHEEIAYRLRMSEQEVVESLKPLIDGGFFVSDSKPLARRKRVAMPEKRREETEIQEKRREDSGAVASATPPDSGKIFDEEFWRNYPRREGANPKAPARKAFIIAVKNGNPPAAIVAGAQRYAASLAKSSQVGTKYVAQAVTWLHQKRWEDYPDDTATTTGPPAPPDPSMPSDEELRRKYGASHGQHDANEGTGIREPGAGVCRETEVDTEDQNRPPDHRTGKSGVAGMGEILPQLFELRSMDHGSGEGGTTNENDGPDTVAGVVRH